MKIRNHQDFWAGVVFVAAGSAFVIGASAHDLGNSQHAGPGYFPLLLGLLMVLLGCLVNFKAMTFETDDGAPVGMIDWRRLLAVIGSVLLAGLALPVLGLLLSVVLLAAVPSLGGGPWSVKRWLAGSAAANIVSWLVYIHLLGLPVSLLPALSG